MSRTTRIVVRVLLLALLALAWVVVVDRYWPARADAQTARGGASVRC